MTAGLNEAHGRTAPRAEIQGRGREAYRVSMKLTGAPRREGPASLPVAVVLVSMKLTGAPRREVPAQALIPCLPCLNEAHGRTAPRVGEPDELQELIWFSYSRRGAPVSFI